MPWYEVKIGYSWRCGAEWDEYLVKARSETHAADKVLEVRETPLRDRDEVKVKTVDMADDEMWAPRVYPNGVIYTGMDYWER